MNGSDLKLLKQYAPVLRFSGGERQERFYPIRVENYLARCTLWQTRPRLGRLRMLFAREKRAEWDNLSTGKDRAEALSEFSKSDYDYYLRFEPEEAEHTNSVSIQWESDTNMDKSVILKEERITLISWGCGAVALTTACLGLAWGSAAAGLPGLAGILVYSLVFFLLLSAFGMITDWADREFPIGIAQVLKMLLSFIIVTVFIVSAVTAIGWWLGDAEWGKPALWVSAVFTTGSGILYLTLGYGAQFLALLLALVPGAPVRKKQTCSAYATCQNMSPCYYGRVWPPQQERSASENLVLQYFFFYALNDWPTHGGFNYHQGDWEAVFVYLKKQDDEAKPRATYLGLSAHHKGQAWEWKYVCTETAEDELGEKQEHPVVYVAAGSHANYREEGEKSLPDILSADRRGFRYRIAKILDWGWQLGLEATESLNKRAKERLRRQVKDDETPAREDPVPTKEYHKGDGRIIGPPGLQIKREFTPWPDPVVLDDDNLLDWVEKYRGLWGFRTLAKDVSGPPGPMWNRLEDVKKDKEQRRYWRDPVGWRKSKGVMQTPQEEGEG